MVAVIDPTVGIKFNRKAREPQNRAKSIPKSRNEPKTKSMYTERGEEFHFYIATMDVFTSTKDLTSRSLLFDHRLLNSILLVTNNTT